MIIDSFSDDIKCTYVVPKSIPTMSLVCGLGGILMITSGEVDGRGCDFTVLTAEMLDVRLGMKTVLLEVWYRWQR